MKLVETEIAGAFEIELEPHTDERGFFARQWCARELAERGLVTRIAQISMSMSRQRHTLRGLHYSVAPAAETKIVHCVSGSIFDVLVDLRPAAPRWISRVLTAAEHRMLYVPEGVAHGFLTLEDATEVQYFMSEPFDASCARGVRFDDPGFGITWPARPAVIAERDRSYPDWAP